MSGEGALLVLVLTMSATTPLFAQCPDGSPPPCRAARPDAHILIDPNLLAIMPFRVSGPAADVGWVREGLVDLLSISLDGLAGWRVVSPRTMLGRAHHITNTADVAQATRAARAVGAGTMVLGSAVAIGPQLRLSAELYDVIRNTRLATVEVRGVLADPGPTVDSLAVGLASRHLLAQPGAARRWVQEYATSSPRALRAYLAAEQLARRSAWQRAADSLLGAIALDSAFGLAYYRLNVLARFGAATPGWTRVGLLRAGMKYVDRLPQRQRDLLLTALATHQGHRVVALSRADELGRHYPDDPEAAFEQGESYFHIGLEAGEPAQRALEAFERAVALDPRWLDPYFHAIELRCLLGDTASAWALLRRALALAPTYANVRARELVMRAALRGEDPAALARGAYREPDGPLILLLAQGAALRMLDGDPSQAIALADSIAALAAAPDQPRSQRVGALLARGLYRLGQGRHGAAWRSLQAAATLEPAGPRVLAQIAVHALLTGTHRDEGRAAARTLATTEVAAPGGPLLLAWEAVQDGDPVVLDSALRMLTGRADANPDYAKALVLGLSGLADLSQEISARARERLEAGTRVRPFSGGSYIGGSSEMPGMLYSDEMPGAPTVRFSLELARLERAAGDLDAAGRRLSDAMFTRFETVPYRAEAEELRAQIAEQRGDTAAAIRAYGHFIGLWQDADPELQSRVAVARAALARLER